MYLTLPFFQELERAKSILLAGAGGGFDVFSGLPLYFGWCFRLEKVAQRLLYLDAVLSTQTMREMAVAIEQFRQTLSARKPWINLPM